MSRKWSVKKRDGAWQAFDEDGDVRYASTDWLKVTTFALIGADKTEFSKDAVMFVWRNGRVEVDHPHPSLLSDQMRRIAEEFRKRLLGE